jgi:GDP-L-fucose synthase
MAHDWLDRPLSLKDKKIWVAGHNGMVGSALMRRLETENCHILKTSRADLDLRRQADVEQWMNQNRPDIIVLAAAKVGGIAANASAPADFLYDNLMIEANVIHAAYRAGVEKLLFLGSSCIYPKFAEQPITEEALLTGPLEPTNEAYAVAKIAGIQLCQSYRAQYGCDFISAMPCNLYGPGDNFDLQSSHVIPALIRKALAAKESGGIFTVWGTGAPRREFMYVDDLADALVFLLKHYSSHAIINVGAGRDISIAELAREIADVCAYNGPINFDSTKPDGTPAKLMDSTRIYNAGWRPHISLQDGLAKTRDYYVRHREADKQAA